MARKEHKPRLSRDAQREKRNKKIMSYVLVLLMIVSVAGIWASSTSSNSSNYKTFKEYKFDIRPEPSLNNQYVYILKGDTSSLFFYSLPQDDLNIKTFGNLSEILYGAEFFVLSTEDNLHYLSFYDQLRFEINEYAKKQSIGAFLQDYNSTLSTPIINCDNASVNMPVIELRIANETEIIANPSGCIIINVAQGDVALVRDRLLYTELGIITD